MATRGCGCAATCAARGCMASAWASGVHRPRTTHLCAPPASGLQHLSRCVPPQSTLPWPQRFHQSVVVVVVIVVVVSCASRPQRRAGPRCAVRQPVPRKPPALAFLLPWTSPPCATCNAHPAGDRAMRRHAHCVPAHHPGPVGGRDLQALAARGCVGLRVQWWDVIVCPVCACGWLKRLWREHCVPRAKKSAEPDCCLLLRLIHTTCIFNNACRPDAGRCQCCCCRGSHLGGACCGPWGLTAEGPEGDPGERRQQWFGADWMMPCSPVGGFRRSRQLTMNDAHGRPDGSQRGALPGCIAQQPQPDPHTESHKSAQVVTAAELAASDIVLTTYDVLKRDVARQPDLHTEQKELRRQKRCAAAGGLRCAWHGTACFGIRAWWGHTCFFSKHIF